MEQQEEDLVLDGLNERQYEAVTLESGSALILAGAGSGKTGVLTRRIAYLIRKGVWPAEILAVTFTNKAAGEMKKRIRRMVPMIDPKTMWVGTFHGICYRMIAAYPQGCNRKNGVAILDEEDQKAILRRVIRELGIPVAGSKESKDLGVEGLSVSKVCSLIAGWKDRGLGPDSKKVDSTGDLDRIFQRYEEVLEAENLLDFADLMSKALQLLKSDPKVLGLYRGKFKHILVDEFQDTNDLQFEWLQLLKDEKCHVMAVGDDDQSIYGFRNARPENMQDFLQSIPGCRMIKLEQNYRSTQPVLDLANAIINKNDGRWGKELWTDKMEGPKPHLDKFVSDIDEAEAIVDDIQRRIANGQKPNSIAVIYRTNAQSRLLESRMVRRNIPHKVFGGFRFFERQEIKHMVAYMQFLQNLDNDTALIRIINTPSRKIGDKTIEDLRGRAALHSRSLFSQILAEASPDRKPLYDFVNMVFQLDESRTKGSLVDFVRAVMDQSGLAAMYEALPDPKEAEERMGNIRDLANAALEFQNEIGNDKCEEVLQDFLATATLETSTTAEADGQKIFKNSVSLMTIHTAKGLEFDTVFLAGVERGMFPHSAAVGRTDADLKENAENLEEERRLLYVAVTRAKKDLVMSYAMRRSVNGRVEDTGASHFLRFDVPPQMVTFKNHAPGMKSENLQVKRPQPAANDHQQAAPRKRLIR